MRWYTWPFQLEQNLFQNISIWVKFRSVYHAYATMSLKKSERQEKSMEKMEAVCINWRWKIVQLTMKNIGKYPTFCYKWKFLVHRQWIKIKKKPSANKAFRWCFECGSNSNAFAKVAFNWEENWLSLISDKLESDHIYNRKFCFICLSVHQTIVKIASISLWCSHNGYKGEILPRRSVRTKAGKEKKVCTRELLRERKWFNAEQLLCQKYYSKASWSIYDMSFSPQNISNTFPPKKKSSPQNIPSQLTKKSDNIHLLYLFFLYSSIKVKIVSYILFLSIQHERLILRISQQNDLYCVILFDKHNSISWP